MKQRSFLVLAMIALLFASCSKKGGKSGLLVPKDAAFVVHINSSSLSSKLSWEEISQSNWFKQISKEADDSLAKQLLANPASSGVDIKKDFIVFLKKQGKGSYYVVEGSLTDAAAYEKMQIEMNKKGDAKEIKKSGEFSYYEPNSHTVVLWNKSMFAMVGNGNMPGMGGIGAAMMKKNRYDDNDDDARGFTPDSLRIFGQQALTLEGSQNLDADSRFADLVKDGSDVHMWFNFGKFYSGMGGNPMLSSMMKVDKLLEDNITAMSLNFDNGKIAIKSKHYSSEEVTKIASNNKPENVSADVINRIPSSDVVAVMAFNYSPAALKETLKLTGLNAVADAFLSQVNFSIDDFVKANQGQVVVAVSDLAAPAKTDMDMGMAERHFPKPDMKFLFATAVKDKASFEKMVTILWDLSKQMGKNKMMNDDSTMSKPGIPGINYKVENNWFALSNSTDYADKFLAGGNNKFAFTDKITGHPIGMYVDLQKIIKFAGSTGMADSTKTEAVSISLNMWQDIVAKGGDLKGKASEFEFEINLVDKNTNSLKQLNQYIDKLAVLKEQKMKKWANLHIRDEEVKDPPPELGK